MIYQTKTTFSDRSIKIFPENVGIGYDRLLSITLAPRWTSHMQKFINDGVIDRYFGPHDYVTSTPSGTVICTAWKNQQAAKDWAEYSKLVSTIANVEIIEISE
jgi:hypothetical protein